MANDLLPKPHIKMVEPKIFVGAPVRNRAWILPRYIESILKQNIQMETCYIVNDSEDSTENILKEAGFRTIKKDFGCNYGHTRGEYSKNNLALLRNILLDEFLKSDCQYFLSVDTDIILPNDSVKVLIQDNKDIVSMLIKNSDILNAHNIFIKGKHVNAVPEGLIPVDMTGAVYLIKRSVIESGAKYAYHKLGEDIPFCNSAIEKGFEIYCDTRLKPIHVFRKGLDLVAQTYKEDLCIGRGAIIKNKIFSVLDDCINEVDKLIYLFTQKNIDSAISIIQEVIFSLNNIGEKLEIFKDRSEYKLLEVKFSRIDDSIGQIIAYLRQGNTQSAAHVARGDLKLYINEWKLDIVKFFDELI